MRASILRVLLPMAILAIAGIAAFGNSLDGRFVFDDVPWIVENEGLRQLWPPGPAMGDTRRPLLFYSLALNRAAGGLDPTYYHVVNVVIHVLAAAVLYGLVHRTLVSAGVGRFGASPKLIALATALIWLVHPLQTQSVTYIIQRGESAAGLCYLLTLYAARRAMDGRNVWRWSIASASAFAAGVGFKEVAATAPAAVLLYDAALVSGGLRAALQRHVRLHALLWGPACVVGAWWLLTRPDGLQLLQGDVSLDPWAYALTQPGVVLHYLRLALWPQPLAIDHGWPLVDGLAMALPALLVVAVGVGVTGWGMWRRAPWAAAPALALLVLLPTSSVVPLRDVLVEHRMYLPLASVVLLVVLGMDHLLLRLAGARSAMWMMVLTGLVVGTLTLATRERNSLYAEPELLWRDVLQQYPDNARAHNNVGSYVTARGLLEEGLAEFDEALRLQPGFVEASSNRGVALLALGRLEEAEAALRHAEGIDADNAAVHHHLGVTLAARGDFEAAAAAYARALRLDPQRTVTIVNLGAVLQRLGRIDQAQAQLQAALRLEPDQPEALNNLGSLQMQLGDPAAAVPLYLQALAARPDFVDARINVAVALLSAGDPAAAVPHLEDALRHAPRSARAHLQLGQALTRLGHTDRARLHLRLAASLQAGAETSANGEISAGRGDGG